MGVGLEPECKRYLYMKIKVCTLGRIKVLYILTRGLVKITMHKYGDCYGTIKKSLHFHRVKFIVCILYPITIHSMGFIKYN